MDPRDGRRLDLAAEAIAVARRAGDDDALLEVLTLTMYPRRVPELLGAQLDDVNETLRLASRNAGLAARLGVIVNGIEIYVENLMLTEANSLIDEIGTIAARTGLPWHVWCSANLRSWQALLAGRVDDAERLSAEALEVGTAAGLQPTMSSYGAQFLMAHIHRGRYAEAIDVASQAAVAVESLEQGWEVAMTWLYCHAGRLDEANALFSRHAAGGFNLPYDSVWLQNVALWAECAFVLGRRDAAETLYERLAPFGHILWFSGSHDVGANARYLGHLCRMMGRVAEAEDHYRHALEVHRHMQAPYWIARTQLELADFLGASRREEARVFVAEARETAQRHGYEALAARTATFT